MRNEHWYVVNPPKKEIWKNVFSKTAQWQKMMIYFWGNKGILKTTTRNRTVMQKLENRIEHRWDHQQYPSGHHDFYI
jgi:hypothetical protein